MCSQCSNKKCLTPRGWGPKRNERCAVAVAKVIQAMTIVFIDLTMAARTMDLKGTIHVSDVITKANEVLFDAHADVSDASELHVHVTMSTPHSLKVG